MAAGVAIQAVSDRTAVTAVVVGYDSAAETLAPTIASLLEQSLAPAQIICVDLTPDARLESLSRDESAAIEVIPVRQNIGYPAACNLAASRATGEYVLFINPDAQADQRCIEHLVDTLAQRSDAAIAGAQILLGDHRSVNAGDNVLHLTGLSWAGRYGLPIEDGPPRPAAVVSGAALMVRRAAFEALGGFTDGFFMYYDDVDLAWRARLAGWEVLFCPRARVAHDYEFQKGSYKWRYLERNRWWCLLAHFRPGTLLALAPLLVAVEAAICARAAAEGWLGAKLGAWRLLWQARRHLAARRREVQRRRTIGDRPIIERMSATVDSPFIASDAVRRLDPALRAYRWLVLRLVR
jgi:GT2 family glycosyltransferase